MIYNNEFKKQYKNKVLMKIDYPVANSYFQKISSIVGEEKMLIIPINPSKTAWIVRNDHVRCYMQNTVCFSVIVTIIRYSELK